jgi:hypothetical protein
MKQFIRNNFLCDFVRVRLAVGVVAFLLAITTNSFATNTPVAGGSGGTSYSLSCGSDKALVGIKGYAGSYIDGAFGVCAQINYDGSWQGSVSDTLGPGGFAGRSTGNSFDLTCPRGYAVTGIKGKAGSYIDQLKVRCGRLGQNGRFSSLGDFLSGTAGGTGGSSFGPNDCTSNQPARLIRGKAGTWVDSMGLGCEYVNTLKISSMSINSSMQEPEFQQRVRSAATVRLSLIPTEDATVNLTSSNTNVATVVSTVVSRIGDGVGTTHIEALRTGCATITASYKGSSVSEPLLVHRTSCCLQLETPTSAIAGRAVDISVRRPRLPYEADEDRTITLTNLDNIAMQMPDRVTIPRGYDAVRFQVTVASPDCVRIRANEGSHSVINAFQVVQSLKQPALIKP